MDKKAGDGGRWKLERVKQALKYFIGTCPTRNLKLKTPSVFKFSLTLSIPASECLHHRSPPSHRHFHRSPILKKGLAQVPPLNTVSINATGPKNPDQGEPNVNAANVIPRIETEEVNHAGINQSMVRNCRTKQNAFLNSLGLIRQPLEVSSLTVKATR